MEEETTDHNPKTILEIRDASPKIRILQKIFGNYKYTL
jgi:hypothetical protein